jgi:hypothetical protein
MVGDDRNQGVGQSAWSRTHAFPWHVLRRGRPIHTHAAGGRYYLDQWGHRIDEWDDSTVDPVVVAEVRRRLKATRTALS